MEWKHWVLLGEAVSKCDHLGNTPLRSDTARKLHLVYLAKGAAATTRIEGNTLTDRQVEDLIEHKLHMPPSKQYLAREVQNVLNIYNDEALVERPITPELLCELNKRVLDGLQLDEDVVAGRVRTYSVGVADYRGAPHQDCDFLLQELCDKIINAEFAPPGGRLAERLLFGIVKAFIAHLYLAWIHPFGDGNGCTARALEYLILVKSGCPRPATLLPTTFYSETRSEYYRTLGESSAKSDFTLFLGYAIEGFVDGLREQLKELTDQLLDLTWAEHCRNQFKLPLTKTSQRQSQLLEAISALAGPVKFVDLPQRLPGTLAAQYLDKTQRTLRRDLDRLLEMDLLVETPDGLLANKRHILTWRPRRRQIGDAL